MHGTEPSSAVSFSRSSGSCSGAHDRCARPGRRGAARRGRRGGARAVVLRPDDDLRGRVPPDAVHEDLQPHGARERARGLQEAGHDALRLRAAERPGLRLRRSDAPDLPAARRGERGAADRAPCPVGPASRRLRFPHGHGEARSRLHRPPARSAARGLPRRIRARAAAAPGGPHYDRLLFFVQVVTEQGRRAGVLRRVLIVDAAGNRNRFDFQRPQFNRQVPASRFRYTPPRGTRRVRP